MPLRPPAGFISAFYDPLKVPDAPTIGTATGGDAQASVAFTAPSNVGGSAISAYYAVSNPSQITASGASSPVTVTGLTNGTAYTFTVWALNTYGPSPYSAASGSVTPAAARALFAGSDTSSNVIQYITIASTGNAIDFGDTTIAHRDTPGACGSATRGVWAGGAPSGVTNVIDYVTFATIGNATDFGDLTLSRFGLAGANSSTRGVFAGGGAPDGGGGYFKYNNIDYITIASVGNATDFGDLTVGTFWIAANSSPTRAVFGGGEASGIVSTMTYITIASVGNSTSFGNLTVARYELAGCSSSTRGLFAGGDNSGGTTQNVIDYITIASTGAATDFGDLTTPRRGIAAASSETRAIFFAGDNGGTNTNVIDYVTIATTGNATDFGDALSALERSAGCSSASGGVQ
jgi:hypothetical protein